MKFIVIDKKTGKEPTNRVIENIAREGGLMINDIDQFFVGEDGSLVLADDCGNITYCDTKRFKVIAEQEPKTDVLDKIKAEINEYGSLWVAYKIKGHSDRDIEKIVVDVLKQAKQQVLEIIDKYKAESEG